MCPLCGVRKARRACPALGREICAVCCGTKRLVEIACPQTCVYLASSREHPPAVAVKQRQLDLSLLYRILRDLNERQSTLLLLVLTTLRRYEPPEFQRLVDDDVVEACGSMAATYETASKGVIYEHRSSSPPAERLAAALKAAITAAAGNGGTAFERDASVVLRRIAESAREAEQQINGRPRAFVDWVNRMLSESEQQQRQEPAEKEAEAPRLIVP